MKEFIEKGPELFSEQTTIHEYEKRIQELEIVLLKNFLSGSSAMRRKSS